MGFFDWIMKGIGFESEENDEEEYFESEQKQNNKITRKQKRQMNQLSKQKAYDQNSNLDNLKTQYSSPIVSSNAAFGEPNVCSTKNTASFGEGLSSDANNVGGYGNKNFVFFRPKNYEDVKSLIDFLRQGEPAIINFDDISEQEAQRSLDFISGAVCALTGSVQRISGNIFLIAPDGYNIMLNSK